MPKAKAHVISNQARTCDVITDQNIQFSDMLLSESTLKGLDACFFKEPSPIQRKAIPLGRCGFDLIIQAKSGTGKTCVFAVIALEMINHHLEKLQAMVLTPTREIAVQVADVISSIGRPLKKLKVETFIGGMPLEKDVKSCRKCHVAVGAPGRIKHLISSGHMNVESVRLFVLDEADKLMEESFRDDVSYIYSKLPENKQILAVSATFPESLESFVSRYMANPMKITSGNEVVLLGIKQFASVIPEHPSVFVQMKNKVAELVKILSSVPFKQCLVFSNYQSRAESICNELNKSGWPSAFTSGSQNQKSRLKALKSLKEFQCRVLLSTDLTSRGIDAENVNLIVNLDLPYDSSTYLHRIGRAGRFGSYGISITVIQDGEELEKFRKMMREIGGKNFNVLKFPAEKINFNVWESNDDVFEKINTSISECVGKKKKQAEEKSDRKSANVNFKTEDAELKAVTGLLNDELKAPEKKPVDSFGNLRFSLLNSEAKNLTDDVEKRRKMKTPADDVKFYDSPDLLSSLIFLETNGRRKFNEAEMSFRSRRKSSSSASKTSEEIDSDDEEIIPSSYEKRRRIWNLQLLMIRHYVLYNRYWNEMFRFRRRKLT